jgi:hypothetical protein
MHDKVALVASIFTLVITSLAWILLNATHKLMAGRARLRITQKSKALQALSTLLSHRLQCALLWPAGLQMCVPGEGVSKCILSSRLPHRLGRERWVGKEERGEPLSGLPNPWLICNHLTFYNTFNRSWRDNILYLGCGSGIRIEIQLCVHWLEGASGSFK